jgi:putative transcription antitermination factor YqgF
MSAPQPLPEGRIAGIDYGRRRIGIAICDAARILASPLCVRETTGDRDADAGFFRKLVTDEEIAGFVVGLPVHADGTASGMSAESERFGAWLARTTGRPVTFHDERYSSHAAAGMLAGIGLTRSRKKERSDAVAAQVVLTSWLDDWRSKRATSPARAVVGCGYLGERVARRWLAAGSRVITATRRPARTSTLSSQGFVPLVADVTAATVDWSPLAAVPDLATVFWAVGFDRQAGTTHRDVHVAGLGRLLDALPAGCRVIFSSSTGVWGDEGGRVVDETTPVSPARESGRVLVEAETLLRGHPRGPGVALRFAGLYGPGRLPRLADLRAGRPIDADPDSWLNMIHVDDAARAVCGVADLASPRSLYVVSDNHPVLRRDWYTRLAVVAGGPPPTFAEPPEATSPPRRGQAADKRVDSSLVWRDLGMTPDHPDPLADLASLVEA